MQSLITPFINYGLALMQLPPDELVELQEKNIAALSPPGDLLNKVISTLKGDNLVLCTIELFNDIAKKVDVDIFKSFVASICEQIANMDGVDIQYFLAGAAIVLYKMDQVGTNELTSEHFSTIKNEITMDCINMAVACVNAINNVSMVDNPLEEYDSMQWEPKLGDKHVFLEMKSLFRKWFLE